MTHPVYSFFAFKDDKDYYVIASSNVIGLIACVCLLVGAIKRNRIAVMVYLVVEIFGIILQFAFAILLVVANIGIGTDIDNPENEVGQGLKGAVTAMTLFLGIAVILSTLISIYFWICVFSFFRKIH